MNPARPQRDFFEFDPVNRFSLTSLRPLPSGVSVRTASPASAPAERLWHHA